MNFTVFPMFLPEIDPNKQRQLVISRETKQSVLEATAAQVSFTDSNVTSGFDNKKIVLLAGEAEPQIKRIHPRPF